MPAAGSHHRKTAGSCPVHQVANQGGLVAKRQRIHHPSLSCAAGEQGTTKRIGLHGHVDDMLAMRKRFQTVVDGCNRMPRAFHHHVNRWMRDDGFPVVRHPGCPVTHGVLDAGCLRAGGIPPHPCQIVPSGGG